MEYLYVAAAIQCKRRNAKPEVVYHIAEHVGPDGDVIALCGARVRHREAHMTEQPSERVCKRCQQIGERQITYPRPSIRESDIPLMRQLFNDPQLREKYFSTLGIPFALDIEEYTKMVDHELSAASDALDPQEQDNLQSRQARGNEHARGELQVQADPGATLRMAVVDRLRQDLEARLAGLQRFQYGGLTYVRADEVLRLIREEAERAKKLG